MAKKCTRCGSTKKPTKDHIIPLAILRAMGMPGDHKENIQILCFDCNQTKGSQIDPKNRKTVPLMEMYLRRWQDLYQIPRKKNVYAFRNLQVKSDTSVYYFGVYSREQELKDIYLKQRATWRTR